MQDFVSLSGLNAFAPVCMQVKQRGKRHGIHCWILPQAQVENAIQLAEKDTMTDKMRRNTSIARNNIDI